MTVMLINILYILIAILVLSILVVVHEFGHYLVGRLTGMTVLEFSVGFGPKLFGWQRKEIDYSLRAIPLGGYCKFLGEDEENPDERAMNNQPVWRRLLTVLAGPAMNFVFAILVCVVLLMSYFTVAVVGPSVDSVYEDMPAIAAGIEAGDLIVEANGEAIENSADGAKHLQALIAAAPVDQPVDFIVEREGQRLPVSITPEVVESAGEMVHMIGIVFQGRTYNFIEAVAEAPKMTLSAGAEMLKLLKNLVFRGEGIEEISGPVGIISMVSTVAREGFYMVLYLMFIISLNLGIMNLLPIPPLDGGKILFYIIEGVRRKPVPQEKEGAVQMIGMMLLLFVFVFASYQDIMRLFAR